MSNLKNPLLSFDARGTLGKALTFVKRRGQNIAEIKPEIIDAKSPAQLSWRPMFLLARDLWHALSAVEKLAWESAARPHHLTGYMWFMSQALRPNPGLYLPLLGGTMQGNIGMAGFKIENLPDPAAAQEPLTLAYFTANIAPYLYHEGARVTHHAHFYLADDTTTTLPFSLERFDTDGIHDNAVNNSRLTCQTAGKYTIFLLIGWENSAVGYRQISIWLNGTTYIARTFYEVGASGIAQHGVSCLWDLDVGDYIEARAYQNSGGVLGSFKTEAWTPEFMMQRVGA